MAVETAVVAKLSADDREFIAGMFRAQQAANNFSTSVTASQTKMAALAGAVGGVASTVGMSFIQMSKSAASGSLVSSRERSLSLVHSSLTLSWMRFISASDRWRKRPWDFR